MTDLTPMLRQYLGIKEEYPDTILFFRLGDFYEMFFEDAKIASKILGITLTSRGAFGGDPVPMCGIPYHASRAYIARLVEEGLKVAVCEQTEDPKSTKGIVKRDVVRVVTPGSIVNEKEVDGKSNLFMAAVSGSEGCYGLAHVDLSTGEFRVTERASWDQIVDELGRIGPEEVIVPEPSKGSMGKELGRYQVEIAGADLFNTESSETLIKEHLKVGSLVPFGCQDMVQGIVAAGTLVHYLLHTQKRWPSHITEILSYHTADYMVLDEATRSHLELLKTMLRQSTKGSLFQILDETVTPMGSRMLKRWLSYPLIQVFEIRKRLAGVQCLAEDTGLREALRNELKEIYDLERLNSRIALGRANARDLLALKGSLQRLPWISERFLTSPSTLLSEIAAALDTLQDIACWIEESIHHESPLTLREGGIIREGYHAELDALTALSRDGKNWIARFAVSEQQRTGISSLKVGFNKVYGYYIEVTRSNLQLVPPDYVRKQTVANGERYITEALKQREEQVLEAEERRIAMEFMLFEEICQKIAQENQRIKKTAEGIAELDVMASLAETAVINHYVCPSVDDGFEIHIQEGRHPVIEQTVKDEEFVPNDIHLDSRGQQMLIITGPNMAGKSTILRQTALMVLMAQMGSFVPAAEANIGVVDRIFTRVGASDDLARGQSTFMVEMTETANILRHATPKSLVILDEIGRGTSTYDGLSIAWAVAESLHDLERMGVRTLFATHYHELTELVAAKERAKNFNIAVREWNDRIIFLRKLVPGGTSRSYGIQVARIAGLPEAVLKRAKEILENLEGGGLDEAGRPRLARSRGKKRKEEGLVQLSLFGSGDQRLVDWIRGLDVLSLSPLDALLELNRLKEYVENQLR